MGVGGDGGRELGAEVRLFGRVGAVVDGVPVDVGGPNQTLVLTLLAAAAPDLVSADALAESLWGEEAGRRSKNTLQVYVANLRRALDRPDRSDHPGRPSVIETVRPGYRLGWPVESVDVHRALAAHRRATGAAREQDWDTALVLARRIGAAAGDQLAASCADVESLRPLRERADELRWQAAELELEALLALDRADEAVGPARAALSREPLREQLWVRYMVALYRTGRQAQALEAYQDARRLLGEMLGLDPGPELRAMEAAILRQSASLDPPVMKGRSLSWWDTSGRLRMRPLDPGQPPLVIGRDSDAAVRIAGDALVSRRHAQVSFDQGRWWVDDLGSRNGTRHNARPLRGKTPLDDGDLLRIGGVTVVFRDGARPSGVSVPAGAATRLAGPAEGGSC